MSEFNLTQQILKDSTIEIAMEDPSIEAIFANANPEDYLEQLLRLCIRRGKVIRNSKDCIDNYVRNDEALINNLLSR